MTPRPSGLAALGLLLVLAGLPASAGAHHVGSYSARDNEVWTNFKQIKFSLQTRKFDVALRLFDGGALRREMQAQAARLPGGLETATRAALKGGDAKAAELDLAVFIAALARDLAVEADRRLARSSSKRSGATTTWWTSQSRRGDSRTAVGIRLAFEEAEGFTKTNARASTPPDPAKMRAPLQRVAQLLGTFIDSAALTQSSAPTRRDS